QVEEHEVFWQRSRQSLPPPLQLWRVGDLPPPPYLTVVGPRRCSEYAVHITEQLVRQVAPHCTVITGMARGIDTVALRAAMHAGGRVVAVVPIGLDEVMRRQPGWTSRLLNSGALVGERLVVPRPTKAHFL